MNTLLPNPKQPLDAMESAKLRKKKFILYGALSAVALAILGAAVVGYIRQNNKPTCTDCDKVSVSPSPTPTPSPTPKLVESPVNGVLVAPEKASLRPLAVVIENHPDARPQSGLSQASIVYEAIAEGGITRFLAIFADPAQSVKVGPVRSARTYFVDYVHEYQAFFGHVGGSKDALARVRSENVLDLDQFSVGAPTYAREFGRQVALEHTMYSSTGSLWKYATDVKKWPQNSDLAPLVFKDDISADKRPASQTVDTTVSSAQFAVHWDYIPSTNSYARKMAGSTHIDANTRQQIMAKTVILQTVSKQTNPANGEGWVYGTIGSGTATVFQDGTVQTATWKREGNNRTRYYDSAGVEIPLTRGLIWVQLVHTDSSIRHQP